MAASFTNCLSSWTTYIAKDIADLYSEAMSLSSKTHYEYCQEEMRIDEAKNNFLVADNQRWSPSIDVSVIGIGKFICAQ